MHYNENITYEELIDKLNINNNSDREILDKAYSYALKCYEDKIRLTGDALITHSLNTAYILANLNVDITTIVAALIHDVINLCNKTPDEIEELFGSDVRIIVESLSKINNLELTSDEEEKAIYLRKVMVGLSEDVRVLYIKLACRLHNMRTNWAIKPLNQKKKAMETESVLIPIAHRLGINSIKSELIN